MINGCIEKVMAYHPERVEARDLFGSSADLFGKIITSQRMRKSPERKLRIFS
jgi:hypothetical protein